MADTPFNVERALEIVVANARQTAICEHYGEVDDGKLAEGRMLGAREAIVAEHARLALLEQENERLRIIEADYEAMCRVLREHEAKHPRTPLFPTTNIA